MKILYIALAFIGFAMLVYSAIIFMKDFRSKILAEFALKSGSETFLVDSAGRYAVGILGAGKIKRVAKFKANLITSEGKTIKLDKVFPQVRFRKNGLL